MEEHYHKDRVQVKNPVTKRWVLINTAIGSIVGHKSDNKPYENVMTVANRKRLHPEQLIPLHDIKVKIDPKYAKAKIVCDCGHYSKVHYLGEGWCHHSQHPKAGECGCTWYYPNYRWIRKQQQLARAKNRLR